jgi:hypothetical protein
MPSIGAGGILGVAKETVSGTYVAPTIFVPFNSESLNWVQETNWRRPIRNTPGLVGASLGNGHTEGDIEMEALSDVVAYFMYGTRCTVVKTGAGPYVYTCTPAPVAVPTNTLSISIKRGNEVFGYTGCVVSSFTLTVGDDGVLMFNVSIVGATEATQSALTATWPTQSPYGPGQYNIQIPTAAQIFDADTFEFTSEDNAEAQFRLKNTIGAQFVKFGESNATISTERDFETRADYDAWKALTAQAIKFTATKGVSESIVLDAPVAIKDTYEVALGGQGDLVRSSIEYQCAIDATGKHYQLVVTTAANIT